MPWTALLTDDWRVCWQGTCFTCCCNRLLSYRAAFLTLLSKWRGRKHILPDMLLLSLPSNKAEIRWVTSVLVDLQALELLPVHSSRLAVCFSKTHPSNPYRCFWLAPSGVMSRRPGFIPVFRAFCAPEWKIKLLPLLIPPVVSGKQRICFTVVTLKVNWKSRSPARSERLWAVQLCPYMFWQVLSGALLGSFKIQQHTSFAYNSQFSSL